MLARDLRRAYLEFFASKGALVLPSDTLVTDDPTLLFTVAGMVPFKAYFEDRATPPRRSVATSQKCLRTKDIDDIGDISHCTFFEMLGNFSFGDYFKTEAIAWSTEFLFDVLKLDRSRIRVTVYEDDDEAYDLWRANGMPAERITRLGQKSNYWPSNAIVEQSQGPCGPCSEIFFDLQPDQPFDLNWDGEGARWLEIWNNVFTQFTGQGTGADFQLVPLKNKNIDTGMGLERTAAAINNLSGPFETDLLRPVIAHLETLSGKVYGATPDASIDKAFRRIADHVRAATFLIGDGVTPGPSAQGYVLRRLMRRAIVAGIRHLGFTDAPFLERAVPGVIENMKDYYPELVDRAESILAAVKLEESSFRETLKNGLNRLEDELSRGTLDGARAHFLYQTYGLPFEVTAEVAAERGVTIDRAGYDAAEAAHSEASKDKEKVTWIVTDDATKELLRSVPPTNFVGYTQLKTDAKVLGILHDGKPLQTILGELEETQFVDVVLDTTSFYAESGGQIGDAGWLNFDGGLFFVQQTVKQDGIWFHKGFMDYGRLSVGDAVTTDVHESHRRTIQHNHTATHLLHRALRSLLGTHVAQKGSLVSSGGLRFDFSHNAALTDQELASVELEVNRAIFAGMPVETRETSQEDAREHGAMMLFGEKYGDVVRMVSIGGKYSVELCGGTHVGNSREIGLFKIVSEASAAAGVRRIVARTGADALKYLNDHLSTLTRAGEMLSVKPEGVPDAVERLLAEKRALEGELKSLKKAASGSVADSLLSQAVAVGSLKTLVATVEVDDASALSGLADELIGKISSGVVVLGASSGDKVVFVAKATKDAVALGAHCGQLVKAAAQIAGGNGGGRPDFAQAGGKDASKLADAIDAARATLATQLG